jgi:hypothetical protein
MRLGFPEGIANEGLELCGKSHNFIMRIAAPSPSKIATASASSII